MTWKDVDVQVPHVLVADGPFEVLDSPELAVLLQERARAFTAAVEGTPA